MARSNYSAWFDRLIDMGLDDQAAIWRKEGFRCCGVPTEWPYPVCNHGGLDSGSGDGLRYGLGDGRGSSVSSDNGAGDMGYPRDHVERLGIYCCFYYRVGSPAPGHILEHEWY